jgi:hypothetical protein
LVLDAIAASRKTASRASRQTCALAGYGIAVGSAWLGGDLAYDQRIGVTHADAEQPETFTAVAAASDVPESTMIRAHRPRRRIAGETARSPVRTRALMHSPGRTAVGRDAEGWIRRVPLASFGVRAR